MDIQSDEEETITCGGGAKWERGVELGYFCKEQCQEHRRGTGNAARGTRKRAVECSKGGLEVSPEGCEVKMGDV